MKDPNVGWYEYRGARFKVERQRDLFTRYYVAGIRMPWHRGTMLWLGHEAGWFGVSFAAIIRKVKRAIDSSFRERELNGESVEPYALADEWERESGLPRMPEAPDSREYAVLD